MAARSGLRIRVVNRVTENVDPEPATAVFRIFQEALTNVVRHSRATAVAARITSSPRRVRMYLRDNGAGIAPGLDGFESLGLLGMRERARRARGILRVDSSRGQGTVVFLSLPLTPETRS